MPLTKIQSLGITDGTIVNADINASAAIAGTKLSGAGKVLQVVQATYSSTTSSSSTTYADTGLTASITPSSSSNKIFVLVHQNGVYKNSGNANNSVSLKLLRGSTDISLFGEYTGYTGTALALQIGSNSIAYLDSPATTSSTTYKTQFRNTFSATASVSVQQDAQMSTITLMEIAV
jgi:hypothetical protein